MRKYLGASVTRQPAFLKLLMLLSAIFFLGSCQVYSETTDEVRLPAPLTEDDFIPTSPEKVKLGQLLFYDPILSGNKNISCGTCHHPDFATSDGLSLSVGEGGTGLGPKRHVGHGEDLIEQRVPRNSPALFNLGAKQMELMFWDGRVSIDPNDPTGFNTPEEEDFPLGVANLVAAQAMFPVTSETEMAGQDGENDIAQIAHKDIDEIWPLLAKRVQEIDGYLPLFQAAFPEQVKDRKDITMVHIAEAIADFEIFEWRAIDSAFDHYLRGDEAAMTAEAKRGMNLFYGEADCASCHTGALQTDFDFHSIAMPQVGWIRTRRFDVIARDMGRVNESDRLEDMYRFRTPSLRNVAVTAPYGHSGAYATLEGIVRHHLDPVNSFKNYDRSQVILPEHPELSETDFVTFTNDREVKRLLASNDLEPKDLSDNEVNDLVAFLHSLTDQAAIDGRLGVPDTVPSGLPVDK